MDRQAITAVMFVLVALIVLAVVILITTNTLNPVDNESSSVLEKTKCISYDCDTGSASDDLYSLCCK